MKIVRYKQFLQMPAGTVFKFYEPEVFRGFCVKQNTIYDGSEPIDFFYKSITGEVPGENPNQVSDILNKAIDKRFECFEFQLDFNSVERDGLFNETSFYAVYNDFEVYQMAIGLFRLCHYTRIGSNLFKNIKYDETASILLSYWKFLTQQCKLLNPDIEIQSKYVEKFLNIPYVHTDPFLRSPEAIKLQALNYAKTDHSVDSYDVKQKRAFEDGARWACGFEKDANVMPENFWFDNEYGVQVRVIGIVDNWCMVEDDDHEEPYVLPLAYVNGLYLESLEYVNSDENE